MKKKILDFIVKQNKFVFSIIMLLYGIFNLFAYAKILVNILALDFILDTTTIHQMLSDLSIMFNTILLFLETILILFITIKLQKDMFDACKNTDKVYLFYISFIPIIWPFL